MKFLKGASIMDNHFRKAKLHKNIPFIMALIGYWNININNYNNHAIIPYSKRLSLFTNHIQQLEMESNGKNVDRENKKINCNTSPILWGDIGTDVQHTFMQFLHQSNTVTPIDFIIPLKNDNKFSEVDKFNIFNCLAQSKSLMEGNKGKDEYLSCTGNRPTTTILLNEISPGILGSLISAYEHKIYTQSVLWEINPFDQFGVELGKSFYKNIERFFQCGKDSNMDNSTANLIRYIKSNI